MLLVADSRRRPAGPEILSVWWAGLAVLVIIALAFTLLNLLADLAVIPLDPRIGRERVAREGGG